ncbi:hypothetical protein CEP51_014072 [Fusarium floridanum]|uniref:Uncharacterized protein n=1 Tax=Fusarium floridanum TaxID=1325733 RepID=A0A428PZQ2_9HYPO|nr:hypothetical protein CEP51_014072 [Fusarium floridanum]
MVGTRPRHPQVRALTHNCAWDLDDSRIIEPNEGDWVTETIGCRKKKQKTQPSTTNPEREKRANETWPQHSALQRTPGTLPSTVRTASPSTVISPNKLRVRRQCGAKGHTLPTILLACADERLQEVTKPCSSHTQISNTRNTEVDSISTQPQSVTFASSF